MSVGLRETSAAQVPNPPWPFTARTPFVEELAFCALLLIVLSFHFEN